MTGEGDEDMREEKLKARGGGGSAGDGVRVDDGGGDKILLVSAGIVEEYAMG